jgi:hypothetical protein
VQSARSTDDRETVVYHPHQFIIIIEHCLVFWSMVSLDMSRFVLIAWSRWISISTGQTIWVPVSLVEDLEVSPAQRNALRNLPVCCVDRWWQLHHHIDELTVKHWVDQDDPAHFV